MKPLIILGSGRCVWDDLAIAVRLCPDGYDVMAINDVGMHYPHYLRYWYSNDGGMLARWAAARRPAYPPCGGLWTNGAGGVVPEGVGVVDLVGGNSGVNAALLGVRLGYCDILLCGIPLDASGWYFSPPWVNSSYDNECELDEWARRRVVFKGIVRSISGRIGSILED